jgi:hypothetical protein
MANLERQFLGPLIKKALWRYMQFVPSKYPMDMHFTVRATMGIMAKEVEQQQLIHLLGFIPQESPAFNIILKAIFENSASANKRDLMEALNVLAEMSKPDPEQQKIQQAMQELQMTSAQKQVEKLDAEAKRAYAEAELAKAQTQHTTVKADLEDDKVELQAAGIAVQAQRTIYHLQADALEANSWEQVLTARGRAQQLAEFLNMEDTAAMQKAALVQAAHDENANAGL